jgi:hypothetical protein
VLERPNTVQSVARGLSANEIRRLLAVIRIRKRKYEERQAIRAPTVVDGGSRPDAPTPCAHAKTWAGPTSSGEANRERSGHSIRA